MVLLGLIYDNSKVKDVLCLLQNQHDDVPRRAGCGGAGGKIILNLLNQLLF
jgi:hypothetical protein